MPLTAGFRFMRGLPLQQISPAEKLSMEDPDDRISGKPCLVRQERNHDHCTLQVVGGALPSVHASLEVPAPAIKNGNQCGDSDRDTQHEAPDSGSFREEHAEY